jgi:2-iminobutanoate/2-iminopropanoate deaminase
MTRDTFFTSHAPAAIGPYSQGIRAEGCFFFISGQIPLKEDGTLVTGSVQEQAEQVLHNLTSILTAAGLMVGNVVKTTVFLSSMEHFAAVNEVYAQVFKKDPPARSAVAVAALPRGVDVEIEAIAVY